MKQKRRRKEVKEIDWALIASETSAQMVITRTQWSIKEYIHHSYDLGWTVLPLAHPQNRLDKWPIHKANTNKNMQLYTHAVF